MSFILAAQIYFYVKVSRENIIWLLIFSFSSTDLGECLNDEPSIILNRDKNMPPGSVYDALYQCQLEFPGSSVCTVGPDRFCEQLVCRTDPTTCMTSGEPPADGTKCGENKVTKIFKIYFIYIFSSHFQFV